VSSTQAFQVSHLVSESLTVDTIISRQFGYSIAEALTVSSRLVSIYRINNGWYEQRGETTNALEYPTNQFTVISDPSTAWTESSSPSTTWTEL
jgi:hypothetical protein